MEDDDDDEFGSGGQYEDGHWVWDENEKALVFISDLPPVVVEAVTISTKIPTGTVEFRDDIDVIEQIRFRRRYQRKLKQGQPDIITLQDVKDLVLYTAPTNILSPTLINMLHTQTVERFIRAMLLYCQYYLQVSDEMARRMLEMESKIRTPDCEILEKEYADNISDLKILVAKEYCTMLIGGGDTRRFHHMGYLKKSRSLSDKDARLFETLLRVCVQIVWLALGRKAFNQIELELNRLFKTDMFNAVEHLLKTGFITNMHSAERAVLLGTCLKRPRKLNSLSPMINEVFCHRQIDFRLFGLGVLQHPHMSPRLHFLLYAVSGNEENFEEELGITLGILGMPRSFFDTMLRPLPISDGKEKKSKASMKSVASMHSTSNKSTKSMFSAKIFQDIVLPPPPTNVNAGEEIPLLETQRPCNETQRRRWQKRLCRLLSPAPTSARS